MSFVYLNAKYELRPVPGFVGLFADSMGSLWNDDPKSGMEPRAASPGKYLRIVVGGKEFKVHRLVAMAFHGQPPAGAMCRHLNDVKTDNRPSNLAWGTMFDNAADIIRNKGLHHLSSEAKLGKDAIAEAKRLIATDMKYKDITAATGISRRALIRIRKQLGDTVNRPRGNPLHRLRRQFSTNLEP